MNLMPGICSIFNHWNDLINETIILVNLDRFRSLISRLLRHRDRHISVELLSGSYSLVFFFFEETRLFVFDSVVVRYVGMCSSFLFNN